MKIEISTICSNNEKIIIKNINKDALNLGVLPCSLPYQLHTVTDFINKCIFFCEFAYYLDKNFCYFINNQFYSVSFNILFYPGPLFTWKNYGKLDTVWKIMYHMWPVKHYTKTTYCICSAIH